MRQAPLGHTVPCAQEGTADGRGTCASTVRVAGMRVMAAMLSTSLIVFLIGGNSSFKKANIAMFFFCGSMHCHRSVFHQRYVE